MFEFWRCDTDWLHRSSHFYPLMATFAEFLWVWIKECYVFIEYFFWWAIQTDQEQPYHYGKNLFDDPLTTYEGHANSLPVLEQAHKYPMDITQSWNWQSSEDCGTLQDKKESSRTWSTRLKACYKQADGMEVRTESLSPDDDDDDFSPLQLKACLAVEKSHHHHHEENCKL